MEVSGFITAYLEFWKSIARSVVIVGKRTLPKLLMLANHFISHGGGIERMAHELACYLHIEAGFDVTLAAHGRSIDNLPYATLAIEASTLPEKLTGLPILLPAPSTFRALKKAVRTADCLVLHDNLYLSHLLAQRAARVEGKPVLLVKHTGWVQGGSKLSNVVQSMSHRLLFGPSLRSASAVVAVTQAKKENLAKQAGEARIEVIENGIDTDFFTPSDQPRDIDLLFIGRFVEKKGVELVRHLAFRMSDLRIACVGFGPIDPSAWGLPNVQVVRSPDARGIRDYYRRSRLTIAPCLSEGIPLIVPESLACGTPVLASDCAAHPALPLGKTLPIDLDWPDFIVSLWVKAIQQRLREPEDPAAWHASVERNFSLRSCGLRYSRLISDLLS